MMSSLWTVKLSLFLFSALSLALSSLASPSPALANAHAARHDQHDRILRERAMKRNESSVRSLQKRFSNSRFTNFEVGLGACGKVNKDSDFIVALNTPQYDNGAHCFEMITMSFGGKTTQAQIVDECPGCGFGQLDLSPGLFAFFAPLEEGEIFGEWFFGSAPAPPPPPPPPKPSPTTTHKPPPPPPTTSSTSTHHSTSTHSSTTSSSTSTTPTSTSSSTTSSSATPSSTSSSAAPTPTVASVTTDNSVLEAMDYAIIQLGGLIAVAGGKVQVNLSN